MISLSIFNFDISAVSGQLKTSLLKNKKPEGWIQVKTSAVKENSNLNFMITVKTCELSEPLTCTVKGNISSNELHAWHSKDNGYDFEKELSLFPDDEMSFDVGSFADLGEGDDVTTKIDILQDSVVILSKSFNGYIK